MYLPAGCLNGLILCGSYEQVGFVQAAGYQELIEGSSGFHHLERELGGERFGRLLG